MSPPRSTGEWSLAVRQQASVARLGQLGLRGGPIEPFLDEALSAVAGTLGVADVALLELLTDTDELVGRAAVHRGGAVDQDLVALVRVPAGGGSMAGYTVLQGVAVVSADLAGEGRFGVRASDYGLVANAAVTAPVGWGASPWGVLVVYSETTRHWTDDDLHFVQSMANTVGLAIARHQVEQELRESRERLRRVARSLQATLLPPLLPEVAALDLAVRYRAADDDLEIGGDFYDVIALREGAWAVVVGDVCGRGPDAAALTGLVRHSVRTSLVRETMPSRVLGQTNDAVLDQIDDARFCTAAFLRLDPGPPGRPVDVLASCAGHPQPVLLRADGRAELLDCAGVLLGVVPSPTLVDVAVTLEPGDSLVLYTDGVTEARRGAELFGDDRLLDAVRPFAGQGAEAIAAGLEAAVSRYQDRADDDIAIVVVQAALERTDGRP